MEIRPAKVSDVPGVMDIDGTIESVRYLHVDRGGEGVGASWRLADRPLREKLILPNRLDDERAFALRQVAGGIDDGFCQVAEHDGQLAAMALAQPDPPRGTLRLVDLRVDYDFRRQGLATALLYAAVNHARGHACRAVVAETATNNFPAAALLARCGFDLAGIDQKRNSNHDLVKEAVTLFWYASLD